MVRPPLKEGILGGETTFCGGEMHRSERPLALVEAAALLLRTSPLVCTLLSKLFGLLLTTNIVNVDLPQLHTASLIKGLSFHQKYQTELMRLVQILKPRKGAIALTQMALSQLPRAPQLTLISFLFEILCLC